MKKILPFVASAGIILLIVWQFLSSDTNYYLISVLVLILAMLPFFISFEKEKPTAREVTLIASLTAIAVVSRAVFYLVPQVKPIAAVVAVSGVCLGGKRGFLIGALSMFVSNFIFGQGLWTPFQMVAMGLVGLIFGLLFSKLKANKITLSVAGFLIVAVVYGLIVDLSTVLTLSADLSLSSVLAVYAAGVPANLVFGGTTAVFLFFFGEAFIKKIDRINLKYGICVSEVSI
ncbi:MAG: ECF transporter S component [Eubacteriales bacterium]|nr:ECF transporter S component [Eubacteriales bacterium]